MEGCDVSSPITVGSFGGGTNSIGMYWGMIERGLPPPHAILFADTEGEKEHTYRATRVFSLILEIYGYPAITWVKKGGNGRSLEEDCLIKSTLPSVAYGYKACSHKWKIEPQEKWANNDPTCRREWKSGRKVVKLIGYDFDEFHRARFHDDPKYIWSYPLIDWRWGRADCEAAISRLKMRMVGKSACFFCPNSKKAEIKDLRVRYPDLFARAIAMEDRAKPTLTKIKGLGRRFSWREFAENEDIITPEMDAQIEQMCGCYDG